MSAFRPGDVAMAKYEDEEPKVFLRVRDRLNGGREYWRSEDGSKSEAFELADWSRPLVVIDPEDREQVERLEFLYVGNAGGSGRTIADYLQAALREFANPKPPPRCVAHGNEACEDCSRILTRDFDGGECRHCSTYGETGMHWDTCQGRIRGQVFANRADAMGVDA